MVPGEGIEPPTNGLQNRCSTAELTRHLFNIYGHFCLSSYRPKRPFATEMLRNRFAPPVYGVAQGRVNTVGGLGLHVGQHVRIRVQRDADLGVPEALADDLGMNVGLEHGGRVTVRLVS